jgi:NADH:ubiquinone oxidoreductase subunit 6 (subunit J)
MSLGLSIVFYIVLLITIVPALVIPFTRNAVHALLLMVFTMVGVAVLYLFLAAELLAVFQLIVYVGGILVLMAMGIMVLDRNKEGKPSARSYQLWLAIPGGVLLAMGMGFVQFNLLKLPAGQSREQAISARNGSLQNLGFLLMENHWLSFELAGLLLLSGIIGALYIAGNQVYGKKS